MYLLLFLCLCFFSCSPDRVVEKNVVARVNKTTLTKDDLLKITGGNLRGPKELAHATNRWVEKTLLYDAAVEEGLKQDHDLINQKESFYKDLLVSSFLDIKTKGGVVVNKKDVSSYYKKNKKSFTRQSDELYVKHFILPTKKEANAAFNYLKKNKKGKAVDAFFNKFTPEIKLLKKDALKGGLVSFLFKGSGGDVFGPKKHLRRFHVFKIIHKHNRGSVRGLELVYDEIHQRLFKKKEREKLAAVLDSLFVLSDVYVSPEVFE